MDCIVRVLDWKEYVYVDWCKGNSSLYTLCNGFQYEKYYFCLLLMPWATMLVWCHVLNTGLLRRHGKFWAECRIFKKCNTTVLSCLKYPNTLEFHIYLKSCTWFYRQSEGSVGEQTTSEFSLVKLIIYINGPLLISTLYSFWPVTELNLTCIYLFWWFLHFLF